MRAIGFPAKHIFWTVPENRPSFKVVNPGLGTRFVGLSQTEFGNRLLDVRTIVLLSRAALLIPGKGVPIAVIPPGFQNLFQVGRGQSHIAKDQILRLFQAPPSRWSEEEKAAIEAAAASPTPEELADVGLIDTLFGFMKLPRPQAVRGGFSTPSKLGYLHILVCEGSAFPGYRAPAQPFAPLSTSPFYCTGAGPVLWPRFKPSEFFGLDAEAKWGDQRQTAWNAKTLLDTLADYPLPSPLSAAKPLWLDIAKDKLAEAARSKSPLGPEMTKFMLTLIVLDTYEPASNAIMDYFKDRERRRKRNALIKAIALAVVSLILPAVAAAGFAALTTVIDARKKRESAKDLAKAARQFAETDAAFSDELQRAAEILDYQAAQETATAALTPEERDAIAEPGQEGQVTPEEMDIVAPGGEIPSTFPTTELLIGGGAAAVAAVFFAFLR